MEDFEKRIKEYFRERELNVSEDAWSRMETLLDEAHGNKRKKNRKYIYTIAASLILTFGLWTFFKKGRMVAPQELESKAAFVISDTVREKLKERTEGKTYVSSSKNESEQKTAAKDVVQSIKKKVEQAEKEPLFPALKEGKEEEVVSVGKPAEQSFEPQAIVSVNKETQIRIYVNPDKLLQNAEIERQLDNTVTDGKNFWKKIKEINTVVENSK